MYSEVFAEFDAQEWHEIAKFNLLIDFLDRNDDKVVTPDMLRDYLQEVADEENE
jgi:hypothetical protein